MKNNEKKIEELVIFSGSFEDIPENKDIIIPEGFEEIGENAFRDFENLETITLPKSLKKISACAFSGCQRLKKVNPGLYSDVRTVLDVNKAERHIRGGMATKQKFSK
jgi:putative DeoR family transcriptional regulator (stage III sporulation protein D)